MRDLEADARQIRRLVSEGEILLTRHGDEEALAEHILVADIREALVSGIILEDYPEHQRGPCCLMYGRTKAGRNLHVVVSKDATPVVVITVYEPRPPYWTTPRERGGR
jgi:hypothetical protein